ncbi:dTDP-4-dehydrorhamnose reductase family protein [Rhodoferax sp.]|uniref:dTDP-4-dehydrorhamnose reductase family protein n=1 Tax=Rhodoferax sp. TaxID=50421 RepID=UPI003785069C
MTKSKRIVILGASGMLGNAVLRFFARETLHEVFGTVRDRKSADLVQRMAPTAQLFAGIDVEDMDSLIRMLAQTRPELVINCIGVVKQLAAANDTLHALPINALLPHRLAQLSAVANARLVHMSTDCVFSGTRGSYTEDESPDAQDLYGRSKLLGEVDYPNAITLRTSIIGHELAGARSLVDWFLSQDRKVSGYKNAIFSGLPTVEIARIICDHVIPNPHLRGLYHLSATPISKFDLLCLIRSVYQKDIEIVPDESLIIDRSLDSQRFRAATGFQPETWEVLVKRMHAFK